MRLLAVLAALVASLAAVTAALAHAEPVEVNPGDGAVLAESPLAIEVRMSQEMARQAGANTLRVFDAAGAEVTRVDAVIDNADRRRLSVALPANLPPGDYTVRWTTLSAEDGDTAEGEWTFAVDPSRPASPGVVNLRDGYTEPAPAATAAPSLAPALVDNSGGGTSWVLVVAVAVGMFVVGSGTAYLLIQKQP
jgi:methionine-rich copper-binding protein CopC